MQLKDEKPRKRLAEKEGEQKKTEKQIRNNTPESYAAAEC